MRPVAALLCASPLLVACSTTYHPEYHPETSYTYLSAEHATYVQNASYASAPARPAPADTPIPCLRALQHCPQGDVSSPGGIVIYGNFTGNIYLTR